jgi:hypothetical protein
MDELMLLNFVRGIHESFEPGNAQTPEFCREPVLTYPIMPCRMRGILPS